MQSFPYRTKELTELFDDYANNVNHILWPLQSLICTGKCWSNVLDRSLHHHHQNNKSGNIFRKNAGYPQTVPKT